MGFTRAQKEAYFVRLKELIVKYRVFIRSVPQFLNLMFPSFHLHGQC